MMTGPAVGTASDVVTPSRQPLGSRGMYTFGASVVALLLYALLADAAIETFASGSPVRWWVAGTILTYAAATVALWRVAPGMWARFGWRARAATSFFVLLGLLAFTAWRAGGQVAGVKLAGQSTSTVFAAVSTAAVLLSAVALLRALKSAPVWARAAGAAFAGYALAALVIGLAHRTPYSDLVRGGSLWARAPFWLQGAFLGVFVVVPLAVLAELLALVRRVTAGNAWSPRLMGAVTLALSVAMAAPALMRPRSSEGLVVAGSVVRFAFANEAQLRQAAAERLVDEPPATPTAVDAGSLVERASSAVRGFRPEDWEIGPLAASLGSDPAAAFAFVRDAIGFDAYAGVLRGAEGALAAHAGNAWDRALLLRALLARSGLKTRLAFATLDSDTAVRVIRRTHLRRTRRPSEAAPAGLLGALATSVAVRARRDDAALRLALGGRLNELGVDDGEQLRQDVARHAWVQLERGGAWVDLDPTLPDARMGTALVAASSTAEDVPAEQQQTVVVRVVAESLVDDRLSETVPLERELPAAVAAREYLRLGFVAEGGDGGGMLSARKSAASIVPRLRVNDQVQAGHAIAIRSGGGGAGFQSFFGGGDESAAELTALFIEVETRVPGRQPVVARHVLLDRVVPEDRSGSKVSAGLLKPLSPPGGIARALTGFHHLLVSTGGASPLEMARLRLAAMEDAPASPSHDRPTGAALLFWACDLTLVEGSERLVVQAADASEPGRSYVGQPRIFVGSWFPPTGDEDLARETDLLLDSARLLPADGTPVGGVAQRQLQYGALQSALETEIGLRFAAASDPEGRTIVSTSLATGGPLTVLAPPDVQQLPARAASSLRQALLAGNLAVVPGDVGSAQVWWTVARSGFARAIIRPGFGGWWQVGRKPRGSGPGNNSGGQSGQYASLVKQKADEVEVVTKVTGQGVRAGYADASSFEAGAETATNLARYRQMLASMIPK